MIKLKALAGLLRKELYDERFGQNRGAYLLQGLLTSVVVFFILISLSEVSTNVVAASLASTAFFVFALPHSPYAKAKCIIGGYIIGAISGAACALIMTQCEHILPPGDLAIGIFGAVCMFMSFLLMVVTGLEHPPACSFALALILHKPSLWAVAVTIASLSIITVTRYLLNAYLRNLI